MLESHADERAEDRVAPQTQFLSVVLVHRLGLAAEPHATEWSRPRASTTTSCPVSHMTRTPGTRRSTSAASSASRARPKAPMTSQRVASRPSDADGRGPSRTELREDHDQRVVARSRSRQRRRVRAGVAALAGVVEGPDDPLPGARQMPGEEGRQHAPHDSARSVSAAGRSGLDPPAAEPVEQPRASVVHVDAPTSRRRVTCCARSRSGLATAAALPFEGHDVGGDQRAAHVFFTSSRLRGRLDGRGMGSLEAGSLADWVWRLGFASWLRLSTAASMSRSCSRGGLAERPPQVGAPEHPGCGGAGRDGHQHVALVHARRGVRLRLTLNRPVRDNRCSLAHPRHGTPRPSAGICRALTSPRRRFRRLPGSGGARETEHRLAR